MNKILNYILSISLTLIFILLLGYYAGREGMLIALLISLFINFSIYNKKREGEEYGAV
ncbi:hypothetical protein MNB_SV-5-1461 [hydrothermal vent metagenome]|uniref:Uncharacterized protein n=1 Tax=hydrothermal vent metagenome TaxID=652676 RepID=A0A1W1EFK3_9ZZZZ